MVKEEFESCWGGKLGRVGYRVQGKVTLQHRQIRVYNIPINQRVLYLSTHEPILFLYLRHDLFSTSSLEGYQHIHPIYNTSLKTKTTKPQGTRKRKKSQTRNAYSHPKHY